MIDVTKPLELEDGTPVTFARKPFGYAFKGRANEYTMISIPGVVGAKAFHLTTGKHYLGEYPNLRNKVMKLVDVNKPVIVGGKEAKIIHQFDNGNLAVVVDGWAEVQNYNKYGQANGEGGAVLRNQAEVKTTFWCIWNDSGIGSAGYNTQKDAERRKDNAPNCYAGTLKLTLVDGIATSAEIV